MGCKIITEVRPKINAGPNGSIVSLRALHSKIYLLFEILMASVVALGAKAGVRLLAGSRESAVASTGLRPRKQGARTIRSITVYIIFSIGKCKLTENAGGKSVNIR